MPNDATAREDSVGEGGGFRTLWALITSESCRRFSENNPAQAQHLRGLLFDPEKAAAFALENGLRVPGLKALEAGVAWRFAVFRLSSAAGLATRIEAREIVDPRLPGLLLGAFPVYLYAYLDATENFINEAFALGRSGDRLTKAHRHKVRAWADRLRKALGNARHSVAHAGTAYISAVDEVGLWLPILLAGAATDETLGQWARENEISNIEKFVERAGRYRESAVIGLAGGEALCRETADLLRTRLRGN